MFVVKQLVLLIKHRPVFFFPIPGLREHASANLGYELIMSLLT